MGLLVFFIIWYNVFAKNSPRMYGKLKNNGGKIIGAVVLLSILSSSIPSVLSISIWAAVGLLIACSPFYIVYRVLKSLFGNQNSSRYKNYYDDKVAKGSSYVSQNQKSKAQSKVDQVVSGLTRSVPKRKKIVKKFNDKYDLNLTEEEIALMVDASYMSYFWEKEIFDMTKDYEVATQWLNGESAWLRAYLRVFPVQTVSSDYERQKQICVEVFDEIFKRVDPGNMGSIEECIAAINNRYMTSFDETTFMIAYRFLEENGRKHGLPKARIIGGDTELDRLMRRYDEEKASSERKGRGGNGTRAF